MAVVCEFPLFLIPKLNGHWSKFFTCRMRNLIWRAPLKGKQACHQWNAHFLFLLGWVTRKRIQKANQVPWKAFWEFFLWSQKYFVHLRVTPPWNHLWCPSALKQIRIKNLGISLESMMGSGPEWEAGAAEKDLWALRPTCILKQGLTASI